MNITFEIIKPLIKKLLKLLNYKFIRKSVILSVISYLFYSLLVGIRRNYYFYKCYVSTGIFLRGSSSVFFDSKNIVVGRNFRLGIDCKIYAQDKYAKIYIGDNVSLNDNVTINADNEGCIRIGNNTVIGPGSIIRASNHVFKSVSKPFKLQGHDPGIVEIGSNVWIGASVVILPNVSIGDNVVIGAGSVVAKNIPSNSLAFGVPAKKYKEIK